ncbi:MAG: FAD-binding oxidoreductase [Candidatus Hydrogenedentes bacterium]|nr:FAD-binding oxidoreductase [Candidatus Hydrogenedentota bacterium]
MSETAIKAWSAALGASGVAADNATLDRYARTTQVTGTRPVCVLYPRSTHEVQEIVRVAAAQGVVLYPISRGKNWGYGDMCAPTEGAAIVDLSRMNRILEVNTELAYAVIEPGVSQQELFDYLQEHQTGLWMDSTGAGPDSSLVGNTLDRGFGHTRYGDHFATASGFEIVMADGRVLNTSFGHYPNGKATHVYPYGVGPYLDGLFCQSNLGIITRITVWLMPKPDAFQLFFLSVKDEDKLTALVDRLRPMRLAGILTSAVHIANDLRLLSATGRYPWSETGGKTPMPPEVRARLRRDGGMGAWNVAGALTGTRSQVRGACAALRKAVAGLGRPIFVGDTKLALAKKVARGLNSVGLGTRLTGKLRSLIPNYGLLKGFPAIEPLMGPQWLLRNPPSGPPCDPLDAGCGLIWISPVLPMTGRDARAVLDIVSPVFAKHAFDMPATFTLLNERSMVGILNVAFDKSLPEEAARATACYDEAVDALIAQGYIPYRTGLRGMPKLVQPGDTFWEVAQQVKRALDPSDIISRGRYIPPTK